MYRPGEDKPFRIHTISEDITERKQAEEELRASEEGLARAQHIARLGFWDWIITTGDLYWSDETYRTFGFEPGAFTPTYDVFRSVVHPEDLEFLQRHVDAAVQKGAEYSIDFRIVLPGGETRWVHAQGEAECDAKGEAIRFVGTQMDITERKQAEEELAQHRDRLEELVEERTRELRDAQEELVRKERLALLGQLAGGVSHELRNPLGAIRNVAYFLKLVLKQPEPRVAESLNQLDRAVTRADRIIGSLLDFARQRPPTLLSVNVNDVVKEALSQVGVPDRVELVTHLDDTLLLVPADPGQLGQVFENLIANAVQAMVDGGRLTVRSECSGAGSVAVSIADTGAGLSLEDLAKVFQPLFTTKARGIGLGLAISKTMVEAHGGSIDAQSKPGAGSTFTVRLPARSEEEREVGERLEPAATRGSEQGLSGDGDGAPSL
jgi:PAS domain S-box-containing protein